MTDRRQFLQLAGVALAATEACALGPTDEKIVPYVHDTPEATPGKPTTYATALAYNGYARPVLATTLAGRPVKIDGNPDHPATLGGGSTPFEQASLFDLYNDGRLKQVMYGKEPSTYAALFETIARFAGPLTLVLEPTTSPTIARLAKDLVEAKPKTRVMYAGLPHKPAPVYDFSGIECIASFDSDLLRTSPLAVRYGRQIGDAKRARYTPCRIYAAESSPRSLGLIADRRHAARPSTVHAMIAALAHKLDVTQSGPSLSAEDAALVDAMADNLRSTKGNSLVVCDTGNPLTHAINDALSPERVHWLADHRRSTPFDSTAMADALVVAIGGNPSRTVPGFAEGLAKAATSVTFSLFPNTTTRASTWSAPLSHAFETWLDLYAADGALTIAQPLVRPLFATLGTLEILARLGGTTINARDAVRATHPDIAFETVLRLGYLPQALRPSLPPELTATEPPTADLELDIVSVNADGAFLHNPYLLELPQPLTSLTWENAALISENTAKAHGLVTGDVVRLNTVELPVIITPGQADKTLTVHAGWGELSAVTNTVLGADVTGITGPLVKTGRHVALAVTQPHSAHREDVTRVTTRNPSDIPRPPAHDLPSLHDAKPSAAHQWGMAVDMNTCIGCNACVIACQVENNVPVVGKASVARNRHMHWLRIDTVIADNTLVQQPMMCQHCEAAPCEYVCPVNATTHSPDGINEMTYNRCVGTRFCSNNCPYKVRRFNWYDFTRDTPPVAQLGFNPNVTVRARGVMEKCTFCVQRVRRAAIDARLQSRPLGTDEFTSACAQACPTGAIVFGNIADKNAQVTRLHARADAYGALEDIGTRPRVRYLPKKVDA